jgi:hypothetical protein
MPLLPNPIREIAPEPPIASLLTVARTMPGPFEEWRSGVSWYPNGCERIAGWADCDDPERPDEKCDPTPQTAVVARPWIMYLPDGGCDDPSPGIDWNARAAISLAAYRAGAVSRELATGEHVPSNLSLENTALALGPGPVNIGEAFSLLLQARVTAGFLGIHTIHLPMWLIPSADTAYLNSDTGQTAALGNVRVSPGPGYPGRNPTSVGVPANPATGQGWVYITGPVEFGLGPVSTPMDRESQRHRTNKTYWLAEQPAIVRFDPCGVFAVLARIGD